VFLYQAIKFNRIIGGYKTTFISPLERGFWFLTEFPALTHPTEPKSGSLGTPVALGSIISRPRR
jgi:hypothetical protein